MYFPFGNGMFYPSYSYFNNNSEYLQFNSWNYQILNPFSYDLLSLSALQQQTSQPNYHIEASIEPLQYAMAAASQQREAEDVEPMPLQKFIPIKNEQLVLQVKRKSKKEIKVSQSCKKEKINDQRNLMSNTVHQLFSFILNQSRSKKQALFVFFRHSNSNDFNIKRFYMEKLSSYLTQKSLELILNLHDPKCELYCAEEQQFYLKVLRILALRFLRNQSNFVMLTSRRMGSHNRSQHIKLRRKLRLIVEQNQMSD